MDGERFRRLDEVRAAMTWRVAPGRFVLAGFPAPPDARDLELVGESGQLVREGGETTLFVPAEALAGLRARHPEARVEEGLAWIRFEGAMAWDLVGFLAWVTGELAAAGVPLGAICGYSRDHLFVGEPHLATARGVLARLLGPEAAPGR